MIRDGGKNMLSKNIIITWIILFAGIWVLSIVITFFLHAGIADYSYSGFPLKYSEGGGMCVNGPCPTQFYLLNLIIDIIIWIIISFGLAYLIEKQSQKNKK